MPSEKAIFLDRDNTIIENDGYLGDPSKVKLLPGAATALASMRTLGYRLIVVSNQSGVARGMFKETDVEAVNDEMSRQLKEKAGAYIDASYYCPYHPEAPIADYRLDHDWRKPKPGMLRQAAADFSLDLAQCWMIGDAPRDIAAGAAAGCRTILLRDPDKNPVSNVDAITVSPNFVVKSLADAARIIVREGRTHPTPQPVPPTPPPAASAPEPAPVSPTPAPVAVAQPSASTPQPSAHLTLTSAIPDSASLASATVGSGSAQSTPEAHPAQEKPAPQTRPSAEPILTQHQPGTSISPQLGRPTSANLERNLEELVVQLRTQNRNADLRPDFSYSTIAAIICQLLAIAAFLIALPTFLARPLSSDSQAEQQNAVYLGHFGGIFWISVAIFFQGIVIALLLYSRNKRA